MLLAALLGVVGGTVLTAAAGARRTDTAYPRLLVADHAGDVLISPNGTGLTGFYSALVRVPSVASSAVGQEFNVAIPRSGTPDVMVQAEASPQDRYGAAIDAVKILDGRLADPADARVVMVDPEMAQREHLQPGSTLRLLGLRFDAQGNPDFLIFAPHDVPRFGCRAVRRPGGPDQSVQRTAGCPHDASVSHDPHGIVDSGRGRHRHPPSSGHNRLNVHSHGKRSRPAVPRGRRAAVRCQSCRPGGRDRTGHPPRGGCPGSVRGFSPVWSGSRSRSSCSAGRSCSVPGTIGSCGRSGCAAASSCGSRSYVSASSLSPRPSWPSA